MTTVPDRYLEALEWMAEALALPAWGTPQAWAEIGLVALVAVLLGRLILVKVSRTLKGFLPGFVGLVLALVVAVGAAASVLVWAPPDVLGGSAGPWLVLAAGIGGLVIGALLGLPWLAGISAGQAVAGVVLTYALATGVIVLERAIWQAMDSGMDRVEERDRNLPG